MLPELITGSILVRGGAIVQPQHILGRGGGVIETLQFYTSCFVISEALGVLMVACVIVWGVTER